MTVVQPNSIAGINSITVQSGNSLAIHKSDGTLIREIVASTGITTYSSISVGSATTTNNAAKSINIGLGASISQHADNSLSFGTNGDERARITSTGELVIGATTSKAKFEIKDNGYTATSVIQRISTDDASPYALVIANDTCSGTADKGMQFFVNNGGAHYIRCRGHATAGNNDLNILAQNHMKFSSGSSETERVRITSAGDVGISTLTPASKLHLYDAASDGLILQSPSGLHYIWAIQSSGNLSNGSLAGELGIRAQSGLSISANGGTGTQLRIESGGDVGIGVADPVCKLDVAGAGRFGSANTNKHQDGCIIERSSTDGIVHITAGRASGNYSGLNFYVAGDVGGSGANAKLRHLIDYQGNFKWYDSDGATVRMHINTSGHIGIKTTGSLNGALLALGVGQGSNIPAGEHIKIAPSANTITFLDTNSNDNDTGNIQLWNCVYNNSSAKVELYHPAGNTGAIKFHTHDGSALTERMRIRNDGFILMQATSSDTNDAANMGFTYSRHATSPYIRVKHAGAGSGYANHTLLHLIGGTSIIGEIKQDGDGTVTYATSSDYRLKENIVDLTGAITRLKNLKPKRFNFKLNSGLTKDGFLAHELKEVVPESVNGTKDEVITADSKANNPVLKDYEIGDPVYQSADASRVVPLLTAALQEAITKIETLETKVAALESS